MFLNAITLKNIQTRLIEERIFWDDVEVRAVYWTPRVAMARFVFNGDDVVSFLQLEEGDFVADLLCDSIRVREFYRFEDIYAGLEAGDEIESILKVWPAQIENNVVLMRKAEDVKTMLEEQIEFFGHHNYPYQEAPVKNTVSESSLKRLAAAFGGKLRKGK